MLQGKGKYMTKKEYNGWTNYETWAVKLWMDNEEGTYRYWTERAEELITDAQRTEDEPDISDFADKIKSQHDEALPEVQGFAADLLNAAMSEVNWHEIAESLLNDAKENAAA